MKLTQVITLLCCTNQARGVTSPITALALQQFKVNRQIAQNKLAHAGRHRQQAKGSAIGPAIGFAELFQQIKIAQKMADARRRCQNRRRFGPKVSGCARRGTMNQFRKMQILAGTYVQ